MLCVALAGRARSHATNRMHESVCDRGELAVVVCCCIVHVVRAPIRPVLQPPRHEPPSGLSSFASNESRAPPTLIHSTSPAPVCVYVEHKGAKKSAEPNGMSQERSWTFGCFVCVGCPLVLLAHAALSNACQYNVVLFLQNKYIIYNTAAKQAQN